MMTFDQYVAIKKGDAWDLSHKPRKVEKPIRFVRHRGRVFHVVDERDGLLHCEAISGKVKRKVFHPIDLDN